MKSPSVTPAELATLSASGFLLVWHGRRGHRSTKRQATRLGKELARVSVRAVKRVKR